MFDALSHPDKTEIRGSLGQNLNGIEPTAIVDNLHAHIVSLKRNSDADHLRLRVVNGVVNRLSSNHQDDILN
jgi:hypothetical protein